MTEERKLQITKLLNEYIPKIFSLDTLDDLDKLSIQDLITIFSEARIMVDDERKKYNEHEKTLFKGKIFKVLETLVTKIKTADKLYVVLDKSTLLPAESTPSDSTSNSSFMLFSESIDSVCLVIESLYALETSSARSQAFCTE